MTKRKTRKARLKEGSSADARFARLEPRHTFVPVEHPDHTRGTCKGYRTCKQWYVDLANGWCIYHWDLGKE